MALSYPAEDPAAECSVLFIPAELVPLVGNLFATMLPPSRWKTSADWQAGYRAFTELQEQLMRNCIGDLVEEIRALRGLQVGAVVDPEETYTAKTYPGMTLRDLFDLHNRAYNAPLPLDPPFTERGMLPILRGLPGTLDAGWFGIGGRPATLADIVEALRVGDPATADSLWDQIRDLIGTANDVGSLFGLVESLFKDTVSTTAEGGTFMTLLAMTAANAAVAARQADQMQRIINTLDGGALLGPQDNVMLALRGTVPADAARNVIDKQVALDLVELVQALQQNNADNDEVIALLTNIREKLT